MLKLTLFRAGATALCAIAIACTQDPPVRHYPLRGVVQEVAGSGEDFRATIHHEQIAGFEDRDGKRSDMPSMRMAFGVSSDVKRGLFTPGQKIQAEFDVRWNKAPTLLLTRAEALPADTALTLSASP